MGNTSANDFRLRVDNDWTMQETVYVYYIVVSNALSDWLNAIWIWQKINEHSEHIMERIRVVKL
jgi:hypothetical protein